VRMDNAPADGSGDFLVACDSPILSGDRVSYVSTKGQGKAVSLANLTTIAEQADAIATATNQHFWNDTNGVHVSNEASEAAGSRNILMNSLGILLRKAANYLVSISESAIAFYDGLGNLTTNIVASFGSSGVEIGKSDAAHVVIDADSFDMQYNSTDMVHLGYGQGNSGSGTAYAPYYTLGTRYAGSAVGNYSVAEGLNNIASGHTSYAEGYKTTASDTTSHAEGRETTASGYASHAEGQETTASGQVSHSEGKETVASGIDSHAEGYKTTASGNMSHAEGSDTTASSSYSHAQNRGTVAASYAQTALGKYNVSDSADTYAVIIGNGTAENARSNALTVAWDGTTAFGTDESTSTVANIISQTSTQSTNYPVTYANFKRWGNVAQVSITFKVAASASAGTSITLGTIVSGKRPSIRANAGSNRIMGMVESDGTIYLRNRDALNTTDSYYVAATYLL